MIRKKQELRGFLLAIAVTEITPASEQLLATQWNFHSDSNHYYMAVNSSNDSGLFTAWLVTG
jgi:hypothetical protein